MGEQDTHNVLVLRSKLRRSTKYKGIKMYIVKKLIYGLGQEVWEEVVTNFETKKEAQEYCDLDLNFELYYDQEEP